MPCHSWFVDSNHSNRYSTHTHKHTSSTPNDAVCTARGLKIIYLCWSHSAVSLPFKPHTHTKNGGLLVFYHSFLKMVQLCQLERWKLSLIYLPFQLWLDKVLTSFWFEVMAKGLLSKPYIHSSPCWTHQKDDFVCKINLFHANSVCHLIPTGNCTNDNFTKLQICQGKC